MEKFCLGVKGLTIFFQDVENSFFSLFQQGYSVNYQKKAVFYIALSFHYHHEDITHSPQRRLAGSSCKCGVNVSI